MKKVSLAGIDCSCARSDLKGSLPFRLGTTSYIIPDDILPNLRFLWRLVDDVELLLFESNEVSNIPTHFDVTEMARLGRETELSFSVHLPLDIWLGSADEAERTRSVGKCRRVIKRMRRLSPVAWILHLHGDQRGEPPTNNHSQWIDQHSRSLSELLTEVSNPRRICIETLDYDFDRVAGLIEDFDCSVCLDIGHLVANGRDVNAHLTYWFERTRVFHVHGVRQNGTDHTHLGYLPEGLLENLAKRLAGLPKDDTRIVTLEVFGKDDFERSMQIVQERLAKWVS